jgi:hypothetical protein
MLIVMLFAGSILLAPLGVIAVCLGLLLFWGNRKMVWWAYIIEVCQWVSSFIGLYKGFLECGCCKQVTC